MTAGMAFAKDRATEFLVGLGGCQIGVWIASSLPNALSWALLQAEGAELIAGRFYLAVALPSDAPWALHAAEEFGPVLAGVLLLAVATLLARLLPETGSVVASCAAFWLAVPIWSELLQYGWSRRSALELLGQVLGIPQGGQVGQRALAVAAGIGILLLLRTGLRRVGRSSLTGVVCPALVTYVACDPSIENFRALSRIGVAHLPAILALAVGLLVMVPRCGWHKPPPQVRTALAALCLGGMALALPVPSPQAGKSVNWTERSSSGWRVLFEADRFPQDLQDRWIAAADRRLSAHRERLGLPRPDRPIPVRVAVSERAPASLGSNRFRRPDDLEGNVAGNIVISTPDGLPEDPRAEPLLAMRHAWGSPVSEAMALAVARYGVGSYGRKSLSEAAEQIACEEARYSPEAIFGSEAPFRSPMVRDAVGGAWVEEAVNRRGRSVLAKLYSQSLSESLAMCADCVPPCSAPLSHGTPASPLPTYLRGISFSHEGRGSDGYGSEAARAELGRMRNLGANAVAFVPYAFTGAPETTAIRFRTLETDARVLRSAREARKLGLHLMLKPHLWAGQRFHGAIAFKDDSRFREWFKDYRLWMLHYARLAEAGGFDVLSIGNELAGLTGREQAWRSLIADVRRVYRGPVTYAAHWEAEVESIAFWDALDYIGVNFYFPIASRGASPSPRSPELRTAARTIENVRARFGKPVLFTEVGFPALATAAARPWEENSSALDPALQARCYSVWFENFATQRHVAGMFWWKWPSHGRGSPFDPSHRPLAKPAMGVMKDWFGRLGQRPQ